MAARVLVSKFYNLRVGRPQQQVAKEVRALLRYNPAVLGLCEAVGYDLPGVEGYRLTRDRSTTSRANVAVYVALALAGKETWHDCQETWSRTEHPGTHEPRSWIEVRVGQCQFLVGHQPPKGTDNTQAAQQEGIDLCDTRMAPWHRDDWSERTDEEKAHAKACPRVALADWNRGAKEPGPGPMALTKQVQGWTAGHYIDLAVGRGKEVSLRSVEYQGACAGVAMKSDHQWGALVVKMDVAERWL